MTNPQAARSLCATRDKQQGRAPDSPQAHHLLSYVPYMVYASRAEYGCGEIAPSVIQGPVHCGRHVMSTRTGISFLTGTARSDGGRSLKSGQRGWNCSRYPNLISLSHQLERNLFYTGRFWPANWISRSAWIGCRCGCRFGASCAHTDDWKLRASRHLQHVKIAVAVPGIK